MSAIARAAGVIAALTIALAAPRAGAQPAASVPSNVEVTIAGAGDDAPALDDTIRELAARLHVSIDGRGAGAVLARVQIDLTSPREANIVVTDGRTGEVVLRRAIPRDTSAAIVREEIAHTVQSAIESELLAQEDRRAAPPPPAPPPAPTAPPEPVAREAAPRPSSRSPLALDATTLAGAGLTADGVGPIFRFGGGIALGWRRGVRPSLAATLHYVVPFDTGTAVVAPHVQLVSARAFAKIELLHASWIALGIGAGGGFDVVSVEPRRSAIEAKNLGETTMRTDPILSAILDTSIAITPDVAITLAAGLDADLATRRYVINDGRPDQDTVFALWRVRPVLLAGFTFTALGQGLFASSEAQR